MVVHLVLEGRALQGFVSLYITQCFLCRFLNHNSTLLQRSDECNLILYFLSSNQSVWCWLQALGALIQTITGAIFLDSYLDIELVWKVPYSTWISKETPHMSLHSLHQFSLRCCLSSYISGEFAEYSYHVWFRAHTCIIFWSHLICFQILEPLLQPLATPETVMLHPLRQLEILCQKQGRKLDVRSEQSNGVVQAHVFIDCILLGTSQNKERNVARRLAACKVDWCVNTPLAFCRLFSPYALCLWFCQSFLCICISLC